MSTFIKDGQIEPHKHYKFKIQLTDKIKTDQGDNP